MITTVLDIVFAECLSQNQTTKLQPTFQELKNYSNQHLTGCFALFFAFVVSFFLVLSASFQVVEATLTTHSQWWNMMNFQVFFVQLGPFLPTVTEIYCLKSAAFSSAPAAFWFFAEHGGRPDQGKLVSVNGMHWLSRILLVRISATFWKTVP